MIEGALKFLIQTLGNLFVIAVLLRFMMQLFWVPFRNPFAQFIVALTDFAVKPLRRVVPGLLGLDWASLVLALASRSAGRPLPTFTIQVKAPGLDETSKAAETARHVGAQPTVVAYGMEEVLGTYPRLTEAAAKVYKLLCVWQLAKEQKIGGLFKSGMVYEVEDVKPAVD